MKPFTNQGTQRHAKSGVMLVETLISLTLLAVVILSASTLISSSTRGSMATIEMVAVEDISQQMLFRIEHELANADGHNPRGALSVGITASETTPIKSSTTLGFPPSGVLLLDPGMPEEERIQYSALSADMEQFEGITRGVLGTSGQIHTKGDPVLGTSPIFWDAMAFVIDEQNNPPVGTFEGMSDESGVPTFFRGSGTGFSYRIPIDPSGGQNVMNGDDLFWGARLPGVGPVVGARMAIVFQPKQEVTEVQLQRDLNRDGDQADTFDIGQLHRLAWDPANPGVFEDLGLGPSNIIQEQLNWGGDLNGDGFDDPIFLWDDTERLLHIRISMLGTSRRVPTIRTVESLSFLRNRPDLEIDG